MKVLHVCEYVNGGIATYLKEIIAFQKQDKRIGEVSVALSQYKSEQLGLRDVAVYHYDYKRSLKNFFKAMKQIQQIIRRVDPDVIHVHSTFAGFFVRVPYFFKRKKVKIVYCAHGWSFLMDTGFAKKQLYGLIERMLARKTDRIINISENELSGSLKYHLPAKKLRVIYNGVRADILNREFKPPLTLDSSKINLLFIGRFDAQKGIDLLINVFNRHAFAGIALYLIGNPVLDSPTIHLPANITSLGWIDHDLLDAYYRHFDAIIIPSRWEGFGLVALEAMRNHKAVLASNRGALPEIVVNGETGYLFDLDKPGDLSRLLSAVNKADLKRLGENGYQRFVRRFSSRSMNEAIIEEYEKTAAGGGPEQNLSDVLAPVSHSAQK